MAPYSLLNQTQQGPFVTMVYWRSVSLGSAAKLVLGAPRGGVKGPAGQLRLTTLALIAVGMLGVFPRAASADTAAVLVSLPTGQNAVLKFVDTAAAAVVGEVVLPYTRQVFLGSVLNLGHTVYVSTHDRIHEVDVASMTVKRTMLGAAGCSFSLDRMLVDPEDRNRLFVVAGGRVCTALLSLGTIEPFGAVSGQITAVAIRPNTRELYVGVWGDGVRAYNMDTGSHLDAGRILNTSHNVHGVHDLDFVDGNTLLLGGYGAAKYDFSSGTPISVFNSNDFDGGWGYDWTLTGDGTRILQPGWTSGRVRQVSDMSVLASPAIAGTNFYYGSAASGQDGTFVLSGGDLSGYNSPGRGLLLVGDEATLTFRSRLVLGPSNSTVILRGSPYQVTAAGPADRDGDGTPDDQDAFPDDAAETADGDADGVGDVGDNCATVANANQANYDGDGQGDACDADDDNDDLADASDPLPTNRDSDGDGILDGADPYVQSDHSPTVTLNGVSTSVANRVISPGTTLADEISASSARCAATAKNHGAYVSCMSHAFNTLRSAGTITGAEKGRLQSAIAKKP